MIRVCYSGILAFLLIYPASCNGQSNRQNNESSPDIMQKNISSRDTSPGWIQKGQKILLTGIVTQQDGMTPAPDVVIYYYHTNTEGKYLHKPEEKQSMPPNELGQTHGYIRGWVKTDSSGKYSIYTVRPGTYPTRDEPAHIHLTIKEPNTIKEYYIDDFVFDDDKLLTTAKRKKMENRGGSGVLRLVQKDELQIGERNIILGLNIPDYPGKKTREINSGKNIGEDIISFIPFHAWGPDKGTRTCPICKYGWYHGILYFVGNNPDWNEIRQWLVFLEKECIKREKFLKAYFIYGNETGYNKSERERLLEKIGKELQLKKIALTYVPSFSDSESEVDANKINQETENTLLIYKRSNVIGKYINLKPEKENFKLISSILDQSINEYFNLSKPKQK